MKLLLFSFIFSFSLFSSSSTSDAGFHLPISKGAMIRKLWGEEKGQKYCDLIDEHDDFFCFCSLQSTNPEFPLLLTPLNQVHVTYYSLFEQLSADQINQKLINQTKAMRVNMTSGIEKFLVSHPRAPAKRLIPVHQIWINKEVSPPDDYATRLAHTVKKFSTFEKFFYTAALWTWGSSKELNYFSGFKNSLKRGTVEDLSELDFGEKTAKLLEQLYEEDRFSVMTEIIKYYILYKEGGVYVDYDAVVSWPITRGHMDFDTFVIADGKTVLPWFLAVKSPKNDLIKEMIDVIETMEWKKKLPFAAGNAEYAQVLHNLFSAVWIHRAINPIGKRDRHLVVGLEELEVFEHKAIRHDNIASGKKGLFGQTPTSAHHSFNLTRIHNNLINGLYEADRL